MLRPVEAQPCAWEGPREGRDLGGNSLQKEGNTKRVSVPIALAVVTLAALIGCSESQSSSGNYGPEANGPGLAHNPASMMRAKLNAMSVPERLAYIKKHRDVIGTVAGAPPAQHLSGKTQRSPSTASKSAGK